MRSIKRDIVGAMIISADGKLLMGQKDPQSGGVYSEGFWLIPGGGMEPGETEIIALQREIIEETHLDITPYEVTRLAGITSRTAPKTLSTGEQVLVEMKFINFRVDVPLPAADIPVTPSEELPVLEWAALVNLAHYHLTPPSIELFTKLGYLAVDSATGAA